MLKSLSKRFVRVILGFILFLNSVLATQVDSAVVPESLSFVFSLLGLVGILYGLWFMFRSLLGDEMWDELFSWKSLRAMFF